MTVYRVLVVIGLIVAVLLVFGAGSVLVYCIQNVDYNCGAITPV